MRLRDSLLVPAALLFVANACVAVKAQQHDVGNGRNVEEETVEIENADGSAVDPEVTIHLQSMAKVLVHFTRQVSQYFRLYCETEMVVS